MTAVLKPSYPPVQALPEVNENPLAKFAIQSGINSV